MQHTSSTRRPARITAGVLAGAVLAIAVPLAASAHVHVSPETAPAGATTRLSLSFSHGCDDSPTTALVVDIPEGIGTVTPVVDATWSISRVLDADGTASQVTFTAVSPIETGLAASAALDVLFDSSAANTDIAIPVTQECVVGQTAWTEVATAGTDPATLDAPAPVVSVGAVSEGGGHGSAHTSTHAEESAQAAPATTDDVLARSLAIGGLAAGVVGIVVALIALRTRRARG